MSSKSSPKNTSTREERLKAALKANMGRRKAQARARTAKQAVSENRAQTADEPSEKKE